MDILRRLALLNQAASLGKEATRQIGLDAIAEIESLRAIITQYQTHGKSWD